MSFAFSAAGPAARVIEQVRKQAATQIEARKSSPLEASIIAGCRDAALSACAAGEREDATLAIECDGHVQPGYGSVNLRVRVFSEQRN